MNKQQLANKIWQSANKMRSKIEANEYKDYILGFVFYKFLSDSEVKFLKENDWTEEDIPELTEEDAEDVKFIQNGLGYFIAYEHLFSTWLEKGRDFSVDDVRVALSAFSRHISQHKVFEGVFATLETGLSKLGSNTNSQTKAIRDLIELIKDIPMDGKQDYDVLGFIYEYLIGMFAANAGKKAGEFYTPHEVSLLMSEIVAYYLQDRQEIQIYDPTSGSGSLLINIGKSVSKYMDDEDSIKYYAQELKENTYNLTRMNLVMRGILSDNIFTRNADTLEDDWPYFDESDPIGTYEPLYVDAVVSNPPYSQAWTPENKDNDPRYSRFGLAPKTKADFAFLLHDLYHLKPDGIMTIVLPHGVLFRGGEEEKIRKNLIEHNHIEAIIGLPANVFFGTGIPTIIMVLRQKRSNDDVLIIDASKEFAKVGKNNKLLASHIKKITDTIINRQDVDKYAKLVSKARIREEGYNLNIPRYVDSSEEAESWDIYATMFGGIPAHELDMLAQYWQAFPSLKAHLFKQIDDTPYFRLFADNLSSDDIEADIHKNNDVCAYLSTHKQRFADFPDVLNHALVEQAESVNINRQKACIADDIFARLEQENRGALIDKYTAYQAVDDRWQVIAGDLEVIQSEGFAATKIVDPNMVIKKKNNKEVEVQEGWIGRILPFDLVQREHLGDELAELADKDNQLQTVVADLESLIDNLDEEEKEILLNDAQNAFSTKLLKQLLKEKLTDDSTLKVATQANSLLNKEKALKSGIKKQTSELHNQTKTVIESLTDAQAKNLLAQKWVMPIAEDMQQLGREVIAQLTTRVQELAEKYADTFIDTAKQLNQAENALADMLSDLQADAFDSQGLQALQDVLRGK